MVICRPGNHKTHARAAKGQYQGQSGLGLCCLSLEVFLTGQILLEVIELSPLHPIYPKIFEFYIFMRDMKVSDMIANSVALIRRLLHKWSDLGLPCMYRFIPANIPNYEGQSK